MNKPQNITTETAILEQNNTKINLVEITKDDLKNLAELVTQWQQTPKFMRFLKERPMSIKENWRAFAKELASEKTIILGIQLEGIAELVGFILFHNFNDKEKSLESSIRINPNFSEKGIATEAKSLAVSKVLLGEEIEKVVSWHSAWNKGSFNLNKKNGGRLVDFIPNQTFLPNLNETTDDFKREITKNSFDKDQISGVLDIEELNREKIIEGLNKHNLFINT